MSGHRPDTLTSPDPTADRSRSRGMPHDELTEIHLCPEQVIGPISPYLYGQKLSPSRSLTGWAPASSSASAVTPWTTT